MFFGESVGRVTFPINSTGSSRTARERIQLWACVPVPRMDVRIQWEAEVRTGHARNQGLQQVRLPSRACALRCVSRLRVRLPGQNLTASRGDARSDPNPHPSELIIPKVSCPILHGCRVVQAIYPQSSAPGLARKVPRRIWCARGVASMSLTAIGNS